MTGTLKLKYLGIDTYKENVIYMRADCHICRAEGFDVAERVIVHLGEKSLVATLNMVQDGILAPGEASLSVNAWQQLHAKPGDLVQLAYAPPVASLSYVRRKIFRQRLDETQCLAIIEDITQGHYTDAHIASFLSSCAAAGLTIKETIGLTTAMVDVGERLQWQHAPIVDKHSVGGLPGNRTTPIVVALVACYGLTIPKTSSRAITSPAGTADTMEVMTQVHLSSAKMQQVVEAHGGCLVWGGAQGLSPADDLLIRVERALELDSEGQLIASVLSKKIAVGAQYVLIDIPVGPTVKIRSQQQARLLKRSFERVAKKLALKIKVIISDGTQPVGQGIGPALEAQDVLSVLRNTSQAPRDLREKSLMIASEMIAFVQNKSVHKIVPQLTALLDSGQALQKFMDICQAQGGFFEPKTADHCYVLEASCSGIIEMLDNRKLARMAKLAGAPRVKEAGIKLHQRCGNRVERGQPLLSLYAHTKSELNYALSWYHTQAPVFLIKEDV